LPPKTLEILPYHGRLQAFLYILERSSHLNSELRAGSTRTLGHNGTAEVQLQLLLLVSTALLLQLLLLVSMALLPQTPQHNHSRRFNSTT
jgi:hypothetical protein